MQAFTDFLQMVTSDMIEVPVWEVLTLLAVSAVCQLLRASRAGIFIIYVFTLHLAWDFMKLHYGYASLIAFAVLAGIVLLLGLFAVITEQ